MPVLRNRAAWMAFLGLIIMAGPLAAAPQPGSPATDPLKFLPDDTEAVITINFKQLLDSPLLKKYGVTSEKIRESWKGDEKAQKVLGDLGLDPLNDIENIVITVAGKDKGLFILNGTFDVAKIQAKADAIAKDKKDHIKVLTEPDGKGGDLKVYELSKLESLVPVPPQFAAAAGDLGDEKLYVGVTKSALLIAPKEKGAVVEALMKGAGLKKTALKNKDLADLLTKIDAKQTLSLAILGESVKAGTNMESITGGVTVGDDVKTDIQLNTKSADNAKSLSKTIKEGVEQAKGVVGAIAGMNPGLAPVGEVINGINVGTKEKAVTIKSTVTSEQLEELAKGVSEVIKKQGGVPK